MLIFIFFVLCLLNESVQSVAVRVTTGVADNFPLALLAERRVSRTSLTWKCQGINLELLSCESYEKNHIPNVQPFPHFAVRTDLLCHVTPVQNEVA